MEVPDDDEGHHGDGADHSGDQPGDGPGVMATPARPVEAKTEGQPASGTPPGEPPPEAYRPQKIRFQLCKRLEEGYCGE